MQLWRATAICLAASLLTVSGIVMAKKSDLPDVTEDGLHRVPDSKMALESCRTRRSCGFAM